MIKKTKKQKDVSLLNILPKKLVMFDFNARDKKDALKKISCLFYEKNVIKDKEKFYGNLLARESIGSSGLDGGIAIPYAPSDTDRTVVMGILMSKKGIDFDSLDGKPTHIFVPMTGSYERNIENRSYLLYLAQVSRLLKNMDFRNKLREAKTIDGVFNIIRKYEKRLSVPK